MCHKPIPSDPYERIAPRERCLPGLVMSSNRISLRRTAPRALPFDPDGSGSTPADHQPDPTRPDARRSGARSSDATTARPRSTRRCANSSKRPGIHVAAEHLIGPPQTETIRCAWDQYDVTQEQSSYAVAIADVRVSLSGLTRRTSHHAGPPLEDRPLPTHLRPSRPRRCRS
jgi:hypothetical protein